MPEIKSRTANSESADQISCIALFKHKYPSAKIVATVNERNSSDRDMAKLKRQGLVKGFPDLSIFHNGDAYFIEMKKSAATPSAIKPDQVIQLNELQDQGFEVAVCFGLPAFEQKIGEWLIDEWFND